MRKIKLFLSLLILALSIGNVWGAEELKETITPKDNGSDSNTAFTTATALSNGFVSNAAINKVTEVSKVYPGNGGWKFGSSSAAGEISFTLKTPISNVTKIVITAKQYHATKKTTLNCNDIGAKTLTTSFADYEYEYTTPTEVSTISLVSAKASSGDFRCYVKEIKIYAETTSGGSTEPVVSLTADPTTIDFGTVYQDATVADKTVAVNFANLTGAVTYSGLSTPFTATGAISATGDKITISADASTIGEYSQTLTVASTADGKTAEVTVKMNVVATPAPTGTFTLYTGDLIEGDYVVVYDGIAMTNTVSSNRLANTNVTITDNKIVDPLAATIWHIAKSGEYWTIYNEAVNSYAASNGTKSQAQMLADGTDDKALWTATKNGDAFNFENKHNASKSVNAKLQRNGTYGWACYAAYSDIRLYRKAGTQYNVNVSATENGTVTANPTSAEKGTTITLTIEPADGYLFDALTVTDASSNTIEVADNKFTMPASDVTVTATFKENEKPAATLTLSKNGETELLPGNHKQDDVVTLPDFESDCSKTFVGWSENQNCNTEPEYKAGEEYTLAAETQTLYAVYADAIAGENITQTLTISDKSTATTYANNSFTDDKGQTWSGQCNIPDATHFGLRANDDNTHIASPVFSGNIVSVKAIIRNSSTSTRKVYLCSSNTTAKPSSGDLGGVTVNGSVTDVEHTFTISGAFNQFYMYTSGALQFNQVEVTYGSAPTYSNYSTTCAAAPKAEVNPTSVTANAAGANDKVEVTYENVNTESVAVALFNDEACTEAFSADWLTASLDGDKNITYTVAATTLYTERKAYIKLTAPETTGATEPAVVVIPVTQAGKDKVFASLEALLAAITPTTEGVEVTVTLTNEVIQDFYKSGSYTNGIALNVPYEGGVKVIEIYCKDVPAEWVKGGKVSGTITCPWKLYNSTWELCPTAWTELTYTAPATVSSIAVSGNPTKTTYIDGEKFDPAGLVVTATYSDASTGVIDAALVDWTFDPATLVKGQTSVKVTAKFNSVSSAAYEVTGLTVNDIPTKTVAEFIAAGGTRCYLEGIVSGLTEGNSMKYGNFDLTDASGKIYVYGCLNAAGESQKFADLGVKNGDKIKVIADEYELYGGTKDEAKNVQYVSHISAATITIENITLVEGDEHAIVAVVTPAEAEGKVTYSIKSGSEYISLAGNVITANAVGTATITATIATAADYMGTTKDFTVTVKEYVAPISGRWELVTDASTLKAGDKVIVAQYVEEDGTIYTMGVQKTNNRDVVESSVLGETLTPTTGTAVLTLVDAGNGTFALQASNGNYLYAASSGSNHLKEKDEIDVNGQWTITIADSKATIKAEGSSNRNLMCYNSSSKLFSCYASTNPQQDIALYKKMPDYTRDVRQGYYGTICLPNGGVMVGASIFEIAYKDASKIYFDEILSNEMVAGTPYIFLPIDGVDQIEVYYANKANASAGRKNGLVGYYDNTDNMFNVPVGNYILLNNQYCEVVGMQAYIMQNYSYIVLDEVPGSAPAPAPGVRRVSMGVTGQNTATGVDQVQGDNVPTKMIINGQLYILRGEKMYDAQGKLVK